jgi:hypothetical protein
MKLLEAHQTSPRFLQSRTSLSASQDGGRGIRCVKKDKEGNMLLTRYFPQLLTALNAPIRLPINLKTLVLHVEDCHATLNQVSKAESRQALFNMITHYENTTHTLRLIAIASHTLNSALRRRYVCSKVGKEWIVDEDEWSAGSYSMCLRAGQMVQERPLEGDFTWWWD